MAYNIDFSVASSKQIEADLCKRIETIRLARNITQKQLADEAGISIRTVRRLEKGEGVTLDNFIRVLIALNIQHHLETMLPDPSIRPVERVRSTKKERQRARPKTSSQKDTNWTWGNEGDKNEY